MIDKQNYLMAFGDTGSVHFLSRTLALSRSFSTTVIMNDQPKLLSTPFWKQKMGSIEHSTLPHGNLVRLKFYLQILINTPTLIFVHGGGILDVVILRIISICKLKNTKVLTHIMGYEILDDQLQKHSVEGKAARLKRTRKLLKLSTYVIAKNDHLLCAIVEKSPKCNAHIFDWGLDNTIFNAENTVEFGTLPKVEKDEFLFLSPRSLNSYYNILQIVKAFFLFTKAIPSKKFQLLITEYGADEHYKAKIEDFITKNNLSDRVLFVGEQTPEQIAILYRKVDCSVMYPPSDGLPQSLLESLSCGTPVIGPKIIPYTEWLTNESAGLLVQVNNTESLANAMVKALTLYDRRNSKTVRATCASTMEKVANTSDAGKVLVDKLLSY